MKISLPLYAVVSHKLWSQNDFRSSWAVLNSLFPEVKTYEIDRKNAKSVKAQLASDLNQVSGSGCYLVNLDQITPDELKIFVQNSSLSGEDLVLLESGGGKLHDYFAKKLLFGQKTAIYSPIKLLPHLLCYNITTSDLSFRSDHSLLHLAQILSLTPSHVSAKRAQKRQILHAFVSKIVHKFAPSRPAHLPSSTSKNMVGAGIVHKGKTFVTHTTLREHHSATNSFTAAQIFAIFAAITIFMVGLFLFPTKTMIVFTFILSSIYFLDVLFNLFLVGKSVHTPPELSFSEDQLKSLKDSDLPTYTILVPLYKEANVLAHFVDSMNQMDYPKDKLDVLLLLEEDDTDTIEKAKSLGLPKYFRSIVVPHSYPKTKPKACNYGLSLAKGEYVVIYDAEDQPDPQQLKKAVLGFKVSPPEVGCLQAKLNYHNKDQNLLTRFFTAEYSLWFDVVLPGLQSINTSIPLGGTSNHFRVKDLVAFEGWDAFNVTEDADLGSRLFKAGFRTAIIDSVTLEEANSKVGNWIRQRSRWIKGYMQTFLVHNRNFSKFWKEQGIHALVFQLTVGGKIAFMLINPLLWIATLSYFLLYQFVGPTIESFYPSIVFYMAAFSLVFGNFLFVYYYMLGVAKHGHWNLVKYIYLVPLYWLLISRSALKALYQLFLKPHYWEKTIHGLHLKKDDDDKPKTPTPSGHNSPKKKIFILFLISVLKILKAIKFLTEFKLSSKIKEAYHHPLSGSVMLVGSSVLGNFLNFLYSVYLGNSISLEQFGLISLFGSFLYLTQIPFSVFSNSITHASAYHFGKEKSQPKHLWRQYRKWATALAVILTLFWVLATPWLRQVFKSDSLIPFIVFAPVWIIGLLTAVDTGFLTGTHRFKVIATLGISEAAAKFLFTVLFVVTGQKQNVYLALPLSMAITFLIGWYYSLRSPGNDKVLEPSKSIKFPFKFAATVIVNKLSFVAFLGLDVLIAKIVLSPVDAGRFALVSLIGKMVYFFSSLAGGFILPMVSKEEGASRDPKSVFSNIFLVTLFFTLISYSGLGLFGWYFAPLLFGSKMLVITQYLPFYLLGIASFTLANTIISYHISRRKYLISLVSFAVTLIQLDLLVDYVHDLNSFCLVLGAFGIIQLFVVSVLHRLTRYSTALSQNTYAFFNLFKKQNNHSRKFDGQIRFLILNWRDTKHIWAGGAESYVHELAKNLVHKGHQVTVFCGNDGKSKNREIIDGIEVIRRGGFFMVYVWAAIYYIFKFQDNFDIIVDSENGIPFFTPLYSRRPKFLLVHHVHQDVFEKSLSFPFKQIAKFLEAKLMPFLYRNEKVMAVSESTKKDVLKLGIFKPENICIVNPGIEVSTLAKKVSKTSYPSLLYLGRLKDYKNVDIAIRSFSKVLKKYPNAIFRIAGEGEEESSLKQLVKDLGMEKSVYFHGRVSEEKEKPELYSSSWIMVQPSSHEGWGITVIESNLFGTPVVASDISGLRDSVVDGETGILVKPKSVTGFYEAITRLIKSDSLRNKMAAAGIERAKKFNWSENTDIFLSAINHYYLNLNTNSQE